MTSAAPREWTPFMRHLRDMWGKGHAAVSVHHDGTGAVAIYNAAQQLRARVSVSADQWADLRDALNASDPVHAAAPELLAALKAVIANPNDRAWEAARAVVRRACARDAGPAGRSS